MVLEYSDELRQRIIDRYTLYELLDILNLSVEEFLDNSYAWWDNKDLLEDLGYEESDPGVLSEEESTYD